MSTPALEIRNAGGAGGITVGWLLAIALGGGALLFVSLAFILVAITDRRSHRARLKAELEAELIPNDGETVSTDIESAMNPRQHRRRLTKSPQVTPSKAKRRSLPHILPQIRRNSSIMNLFGSPGQRGEKKATSRRKNSWIDEDAIHGPEMQRRTSKRISLRESWLIRRTPTLPTLLGYREEMETDSFYRHQNYPLMAPKPVVLPEEKQNPEEKQPVSRMPLVRTPSYELAQQRAAAAMRYEEPAQEETYLEDEKHQQQHLENRQKFHDHQQQMAQENVRYGPRPPPAAKLAKLRTVNTDSNLELILRNTAQRLREGSPGPIMRVPTNGKNTNRPNPQMQVNQKTRHRRSYASQESPVKGFRNDRPASHAAMDAYRGVQKTPSPKKMPVQAMTTPQSAPAAVYQMQQGTPTKMAGALVAHNQQRSSHQRNMSSTSMLSEADSLFGETSRPDHTEMPAAGLSSPSRRPSQSNDSTPVEQKPESRRRSMSLPSMRSSVSSALSTVYSEEEPDLDRVMTMNERLQSCNPGRPELRIDTRPRRPRQQGHVPKLSDPFLTAGPAPEVPQKSPRRLSAIMPELSYYQQPSGRNSMDASILGQISGNAQSAENSPIMSSPILGKERDNVRMSILMAPTQEVSGGRASMRPRSVVPMKPTFFAHSTSIVSMKADPSTPEDDKRGTRPKTSHGRKPSVVPPPLNLCPIEASPHVEQEDRLPPFNLQIQAPSGIARSDSVASLPSSPPPNRPLPDPELMSPTHAYLQRMGFFNDGSPSRANSNASARSSQYSETHHGPRDDYRSSSPTRPDTGFNYSPRTGSSTKQQQQRSVPMRMSPLTASIIQLRRMNSQMSTYSAASSAATDFNNIAPESPTLPQLRGGGFSPDRSSSRMNKAGRQNYLNMGTPSPKSARSSRSVRAEGTTRSPTKTPTAAGTAASVEEKENSGRKRQRDEDKGSAGGAQLARGGLKGSFRTSESPRRRLSVRFGDVKEHIYVGEREISPQPPKESPEKMKKKQRMSGEQQPKRVANRASADSLGLYDKDGFLMSSPDRLPSSAAEGATGRPRSGLRM